MDKAPRQTDFYHRLAAFYGELFPVTDAQRTFFKRLVAAQAIHRVLDVACGSGGQAELLHSMGLDVHALDNDEQMVQRVQKRAAAVDVRFGSMEDVADLFDPGFDLVLCLGNSLPHLPNREAVTHTLTGFHTVLAPSGVLVLSLVHFDRVLSTGTLRSKEARTPDDRTVRLERFYERDPDSGMIRFRTRLTIGGETHEAHVPLLPITPTWLIERVEALGFTIDGSFADFHQTPWTAEAKSLLLVAHRTGE